MSNQIVITSGAKVRDLNDVIIGTSGVLSSLAFNVANGVPKLDSNAKILVSQLPNSVMEYQGTWNAATNTPTLTNGGAFNQGDVYLCNVAGTTNFGAGPISFIVGDSAIYSGSIWQRSGGATGSVTSVGLSTDGNAITIGNSPITTSGTITANFAGTSGQYINGAGNLTTFPTLISSIGLSMPSAFSVSNSPLTANGTIAVTGAGYPSQYIRGDGTLADFPTSGGGGSSVSYYLNGGTSQGTIGGVTYYEMSKTADTGTGVDFPKSGDGLIVSFLTDAGDPAQLNIPAGNWNYEIYASMSSNGGTPEMYAELYKYDGTTFTLISTSSNEILYDGVNLNLYTFAMTVPATTLALTDRLAIKLYATNSGGKTTTVHTQDSHLCQVITTFSTGITALNGLTAQVQYFGTGTSGTDFNISSVTATHTFNIPDASASARGLITTGTQTIAGNKTFSGAIGFSSTTSHTGTATFGVGSPTAIDGADGRIITNKFRLYNTTPATIYSDFTTAATSNRSILVPDASGTLALTSDLSSYVPYTGASTNVDLGAYTLTTSKLIVNSTTSTVGTINLKQGTTSSLSTNTGYTALYSVYDTLSVYNATSGRSIELNFGNNTANVGRIYYFPNSTGGTLALTSDLGSYLPLTGGNLTGTTRMDGGGGTSEPISMIFNTGINRLLTPVVRLFGSTSVASNYVELYGSNATSNRTIQFPDASGTVALTSQLTNGTVTSVAALTLGTTGTDLSSTVANNTTTPVITLNVPTASATNRGALSSTDWSTFNNKLSTATAASTYVPYSGATGNVNLGINNLLLGSGSSGGHIDLIGSTTTAYLNIESSGAQINYNSSTITLTDKQFGGTLTLSLRPTLTTGNAFVLTFPAATGTIALTSNLSSYLPLTGGTLTGNLNISPSSGEAQLNLKQTLSGNTVYGGMSSIWSTGNNIYFAMSSGSTTSKIGVFNFNNLTDNSARTYALPDASGTLALLSGAQTFTGATTFSSATIFSSTVNVQNFLSISSTSSLSAPSSGKSIEMVYRTDGSNDYAFIQTYDRTNSVFKPLRIAGSIIGLNGGGEGIVQVGGFASTIWVSSAASISQIDINNTFPFVIAKNDNLCAIFNRTNSIGGIVEFKYNGSAVGSISYNGTTTVLNPTSDQRLKDNIVDAGSGLEKLSKVKIRAYDWKQSGMHTDFGVIAQEIYEVAPECVKVGGDEIDENGNLKDPWCAQPYVLVSAAVKAIQELHQLVQEQQSIITSLQFQINELKNK